MLHEFEDSIFTVTGTGDRDLATPVYDDSIQPYTSRQTATDSGNQILPAWTLHFPRNVLQPSDLGARGIQIVLKPKLDRGETLTREPAR